MRRIGLYFLYAVFVLYSCGGNKEIIKTNTVEDETKKLEYEYVFIEATKQKLLGNFNTALALYHSCIKNNESSAAPFFEISTIYSIIGKKDLAVEYAEKSIKFDPHNIWYKMHLAQMYYSNIQMEETINTYESIIKEKPNVAEYKYNIAALYAESEDYKNALKYFNEVEEIIGVNEENSLAKEGVYLRLKKNELAYLEIEKLIQHYPDVPKYYGILAELYAENNLNEKATLMYDKVFELDSTNSVAQISYSEFLRKIGNYEKSFKILKGAIDNIEIRIETKVYALMNYILNEEKLEEYNSEIEILIDNLRETYKDTINVEALYADFLIRSKKYNEARVQLKYLISTHSEIDYFWEKLIYINSYIEEFDSMYYDSKKAIELFPESPGFYYLNAIAAIQLEKYDEALLALKYGIPLIVDNDELTIQYYIYFAEAYNGIKDYVNSDKYYEKVLQLEPDNNLVLNNYSYYLSIRGVKLEKAEIMIIKCITNEPENSTYLDTYAWVLYKFGKYDEAKVVIEKALKIGGEESEEIIEHYGDILFVIGNKKLAVEYWIKAKAMGRDTEELDNKIKNEKLTGE